MAPTFTRGCCTEHKVPIWRQALSAGVVINVEYDHAARTLSYITYRLKERKLVEHTLYSAFREEKEA